jgi:hypothetical protein
MASKNSSKNSFEALNQVSPEKVAQNPLQTSTHAKGKNPENPNSAIQKETTQATQTSQDEDTNMLMNETELEEIDLEKLEEALNQKDLQHIPVEQLRKVHKVFTDSTAGSTARLGIMADPSPENKKPSKENKGRGRKPAQQLIKEAGHLMINSGQIQRLSESYLQPPPSSTWWKQSPGT